MYASLLQTDRGKTTLSTTYISRDLSRSHLKISMADPSVASQMEDLSLKEKA